jgi:hypothetical protein
MNMQRFSIVGAAIALAALTGCARRFNGPLLIALFPCGLETVANGDFENGNLVANTTLGPGIMNLGNQAKDLSPWIVTAKGSPVHPLTWADNSNLFHITTPSGSRFLDLTGTLDTDPYPVVSQDIKLAPGQHLLQFAVGWARPFTNRDTGIVQVDWQLTFDTDPRVQFSSTPPVQTNGLSQNNWESFSAILPIDRGGMWTLKFNAHASQAATFIGLDSVSLKQLFPQGSFACRISPVPPPK